MQSSRSDPPYLSPISYENANGGKSTKDGRGRDAQERESSSVSHSWMLMNGEKFAQRAGGKLFPDGLGVASSWLGEKPGGKFSVRENLIKMGTVQSRKSRWEEHYVGFRAGSVVAAIVFEGRRKLWFGRTETLTGVSASDYY